MSPNLSCPNCGGTNPDDARRCAQCGAPLPRAERSSSPVRPDAVAAPASGGRERVIGGRYLLKATLATSRVSTVYRAEDSERPQAPLVVKEFSAVAMFRPSERRELDAQFHATVNRWRAVEHPAIPRILDALTTGDRYYVVSEYVSGWSLKRIISEQRVRVTPRLAANWGAQLCELLAALHARTPALYAPFLAPGHVLVDAEGGVHLLDYGLTSLFLPSAYEPFGSVAGYAAPELRDGPPTPRSDMFSLGRVLYAVMVGRLLEQGLPRNLPLQRAMPDAPASLVRAVARAAQRDPARRYSSLAELREDFWTDMDGPLEPLAGWSYTSPPAAPSPPDAMTADGLPLPSRSTAPLRSSASTRSVQPNMTDFGFERDSRFGTPSAEDVPPARDAAPWSPPAARLNVQPREVRLPDLGASETRRVVLTLYNPGPVDIEGRITSHVPWVSAPGKAFRLPAGRQAKAIVSVLGGSIDTGRVSEPQALSIDTNAGRLWISFAAEVPAGPTLRVEPAALDFGEIADEGERVLPLTLRNEGRLPLAGRITAQVEWLRPSQAEFRCPAEGQVQVRVALVGERLPAGQQDVPAGLVIDSDAGQTRVRALAWARRPLLAVEPTQVVMPDLLTGETAEARVTVCNRGDGDLQGTARSLAPWLQVRPLQFACAPGESLPITLAVDTTGLAEGPVSLGEAVRLYSNGGAKSLSVKLRVLAPRLVLNATHLSFGDVAYGEREERRLHVQNAGSAPLTATLQPLVHWLVPAETEISVPPAGDHAVTLAVDTTPFEHGAVIVEQPVVRIVAGTIAQEVTASLVVLRPSLRIEPESLDFGYNDPTQPATRTLTIANDGTGTMAWSLQSDAAWVEFDTQRGVCRAGEQQVVQATAYGLALEEGVDSAEATLIVNSDAGRQKVPLRFAIASPHLACDTTFVDLGESVNRSALTGSFRVFNYGLGSLAGTVTASERWLVVDRASFECETGRSVEVRVSTDMAELPAEATYAEGTVRLATNGGSAEIRVVLSVLLQPEVHAPATGAVLTPSTGEGRLSGRLTLRNEGLATAHLELVPSAPELVLARDFLDVKPGKSVRVAVHWEGAPPPPDGGPWWVDVCTQGGSTLRVPIVPGSAGSSSEGEGEGNSPRT